MHLVIYRLKADNPAYQLHEGDMLLCLPYWVDRLKVTVLCRMDDGYRPACNLAKRDIEEVHQHDVMEWARL
jgi:hypothetical protein